jgi:hypothetical protein
MSEVRTKLTDGLNEIFVENGVSIDSPMVEQVIDLIEDVLDIDVDVDG